MDFWLGEPKWCLLCELLFVFGTARMILHFLPSFGFWEPEIDVYGPAYAGRGKKQNGLLEPKFPCLGLHMKAVKNKNSL